MVFHTTLLETALQGSVSIAQLAVRKSLGEHIRTDSQWLSTCAVRTFALSHSGWRSAPLKKGGSSVCCWVRNKKLRKCLHYHLQVLVIHTALFKTATCFYSYSADTSLVVINSPRLDAILQPQFLNGWAHAHWGDSTLDRSQTTRPWRMTFPAYEKRGGHPMCS